jgi:hypothetical protein
MGLLRAATSPSRRRMIIATDNLLHNAVQRLAKSEEFKVPVTAQMTAQQVAPIQCHPCPFVLIGSSLVSVLWANSVGQSHGPVLGVKSITKLYVTLAKVGTPKDGSVR